MNIAGDEWQLLSQQQAVNVPEIMTSLCGQWYSKQETLEIVGLMAAGM